jgi:alkanesulfonate monooxygenase SsuD/methylene tetrahydromethanopterin reductase-like flavin-dependent oxidoreductase (luciferase family)
MRHGILTLGDHLPDPHTGRRVGVAARHRQIVELAVRAEELGFDTFLVGEHHFCDYVVSAPAVVLAAVAERTTRLRVGTGVSLLANHDPVRVAEDFATLDVLSGGRVELVVGRGLFRRTYVDFGQDPDASRALFDEHLALLNRLWGDCAVTWSGEHRAPLDGVVLQPRPCQPHAPIWIAGGTSFASVDTAAAGGHGLLLPTLVPPPDTFRPLASRYRERVAAAGHDRRQALLGACSHVHVARTSQLARARWRPYHHGYFDWLMQTLMPWGGMNVGRGRSAFTTPDYDALLAGPSICGSPAEVADRIAGLAELLGLDAHVAMLDHGGLPEHLVDESMELLATEALPQLRAA